VLIYLPYNNVYIHGSIINISKAEQYIAVFTGATQNILYLCSPSDRRSECRLQFAEAQAYGTLCTESTAIEVKA
jgi:hypothetical protein